MAKQKRTSSSWLKRKIDKKLYYGCILFTLSLCVLAAFVYSIPAVGVPIELKTQTYFQNLQEGWTNPSPPKPTPIFVPHGRSAMVIVPPTSTFIATTSTNCQSVDYAPSQVATLIATYYSKSLNNRYYSLHLIVVCGTPSTGGYATQFTLTANEGALWSSQFSYHDAQQPGPTAKHTCRLSVTNSSSAIVTCKGSSFSLSY